MGGPREILGEGLPLPPSMGLPLPPSKGLPPPCSAASAPSLLLLPHAGRRCSPPASRVAVPGCRPPAHLALRALHPPVVQPTCSAQHGGASGLPPCLAQWCTGASGSPASLPPCSTRRCLPPSLAPCSAAPCSCCHLPPCLAAPCRPAALAATAVLPQSVNLSASRAGVPRCRAPATLPSEPVTPPCLTGSTAPLAPVFCATVPGIVFAY
jgi:hypothetical protein